MDKYIAKDFGKLLKRNALQMRRIMLKQQTDVMRVYDRNLIDLPISVDIYGPYVRITEHSDHQLAEDDVEQVCDIVSRMLYVERDHVVFRPRKGSSEKALRNRLSGQSQIITVRENGLLFLVNLTDYSFTGLTLEQAVARNELRAMSANLDVLNLFANTGGFSVYAASGGAKSVTSVDVSSTKTQWCEKNLAANGFSGGTYPCVSQDAREYIRNAVKERKKFDIIVVDSPNFSNSKKREQDFNVQRDYIKFIELLNGLLVTGGKLLFSTNLRRFRIEKDRLHGYDVREITREIAAPGFSTKKRSLRSWILEKKEDMKAPLQEDVREKVTTAEVEKTLVEKVEPILNLQDEVAAEEVVKTIIAPIEPIVDLQNEAETVDNEFDYEADDEDDIFVLDWDEDEVVVPQPDDGKNAKQRRYERRHPGETAAPITKNIETVPQDKSSQKDDRPRAERRERSPRKFDDRRGTQRDGNRERPRGERSFDRDRPRTDRPYDRERPRGERSFDRDRPRTDRPYDRDRPRGERSFDRDRPRTDRPFDRDRPRDDRSFNRDRPRTDRPYDRDRPRGERSFDRDRPRTDRPYDRDRPRGERSFDRDRPRTDRPFDRDRPRTDRPYDRERPRDDRSFNRDRSREDRSFDRGRPRDDRDKKSSRGGPKPYGYDRFKPTRSRGGDQENSFRREDEKKED